MPIQMEPERFDALVDEALDLIPDELAAQVHNLVVLVEEHPPPDQPQDLLGLFEGFSMTERSDLYGGELPDRVFVFRQPLLDYCESEEELVEEVRVTVIHEIAHFFGISDERLHELGWD